MLRTQIRPFAVSTAISLCAGRALAQACTTDCANTTPGGAISTAASSPSIVRLSADGRFVAWSDGASDLVPGDVNGQYDVFLRDRVTGATTIVDLVPAGTPSAGGVLYFDMTPDATKFVFGCRSDDMVPGDANGRRDVQFLDRVTGARELISVDDAGVQGNFDSDKPVISADGRFVAFISFASNLDPRDTNTRQDVYLRDRVLGTTRLVSVTPSGVVGTLYADYPHVSDDGRYVAFSSPSPNYLPGDVGNAIDTFRKDMSTEVLELVSGNLTGAFTGYDCAASWMSSDGRWIGFSTLANGMVADEPPGCCNTYDAFLRDMQTGTTTLVSRASNGDRGDADSFLGGLSSDRRYVVLRTDAVNIGGGTSRMVRKDLVSGAIDVLSLSSTGALANAASYFGALSSDGTTTAFFSYATNLVPQGGGTAGEDLFVRECPTQTAPTFCFGDGTGGACPCGNNGAPGHGCANPPHPEGARIVAFGTPSVGGDSLVLAGDGTSNSIVTYFQGTAPANGGAGIAFGDGLLCASGTIVRLGTKLANGGTSRLPGAGETPISVRGQVPPGGGSRIYAIWYRISASYCTPSTFSFSSAVLVSWLP